MTMIFENPPPSASGRNSSRGTELVAHPGEWAVWGTYKHAGGSGSVATNLRKANPKWAAGGAVEAIARTVDGEHRVYARWVPND